MANSELGVPVRTKSDGSDEKLQSKIVGHATSGALNGIAAYQAIVDANGDLHVKSNMRALTNADVVTVEQTDRTKLVCNATLQVGGTDNAVGNPAFVSPGTGATWNVSASDLDIRNLDHASDNILVYGNDGTTDRKILTDTAGRVRVVVEEGASGTDVHEYDLADTIAKDAIDTHTYTVPSSKTLNLRAVHCGASSAAHFEIKVGSVGSEVTKMWVFLTAATPNYRLEFKNAIQVPTGQNVLVVRTNKDNQAQDMHSLIEGDLV